MRHDSDLTEIKSERNEIRVEKTLKSNPQNHEYTMVLRVCTKIR